MFPYALPEESDTYRDARAKLLQAEISLRDQREAVAEMRRALPAGPAMQEYILREGPADLARNDPSEFFDTTLPQLFQAGKNSLIVYHFMYGPDWDKGCPMCSMFLDGFNAVMRHANDHTSVAVIARAEIGQIREWGMMRGWRNLRLLSSNGTTFSQDFGMDRDGDQYPGVSVFTKDAHGEIRHRYTGSAFLGESGNRGMDLFSPVWNLYDLLPEGREEWNPSHEY